MIEQYLSNTNKSARFKKILTSHNLNKTLIACQNKTYWLLSMAEGDEYYLGQSQWSFIGGFMHIK
jgi:hypothetical protein